MPRCPAGINRIIPDTDGRGDSLNPRKKKGDHGSLFAVIITLVVAACVVLPGLAWYNFMADESQRDMALHVLSTVRDTVFGAVATVFEWIGNRIAALTNRSSGYRAVVQPDDLDHFHPLADAGVDANSSGPFRL